MTILSLRKRKIGKVLIISLVGGMSVAFLAVTLDQHIDGISPTCTICKIKVFLSDADQVADAVVLSVIVIYALFFEAAGLLAKTTPTAVKSRAPPSPGVIWRPSGGAFATDVLLCSLSGKIRYERRQ